MLRDVYLDSQLDLAPDNLQALSLEISSYLVIPPEYTDLDRLTRLELVGYEISQTDGTLLAIRGMRLQELVLLNCYEMELKLLAPGSPSDFLTSLRKLHIEDPAALSYQPKITQRVPVRKRKQLEEVGLALFQLPELRQLSGWCDLFAIGMRQGLRGWSESSYSEGLMVTDKIEHKCESDWMKVWTKSDSL